MTAMIRVPVLIVGAGVAGLSSAALLARHGVESMLVEKRREVFVYPKARNLTFRTLEILRALGLGDQVHAVAGGVSNVVRKPTLNSRVVEPAMDVDAVFSELVGFSPEPVAQYCPQSRLEPILLADARHRGSQIRYGTQLVDFTEDADGITAALSSGESVRADQLIAADGVHSPIRGALGIGTSGCGALPIYVVFIYFRGRWRTVVPDLKDGDAIQVGADGIFLAVDEDRGLFIATYLPEHGESAEQFTPDRCREIITAAIGADLDVEIIEVAPWQPYEQVADQFHCGRIYLVGDAAHAMPPFKGGGANTAIQSAHNLAWKLAAVHHGAAGPGLLRTYHDERYPVGRFTARQSLIGPPLALLKVGDAAPGLAAGEEAPLFSMVIGYQYHSAAVVSDSDAKGQVTFVDELTGQPGTRMPHLWLRRDGAQVSTLDLVDSGFALFTAGTGWTAAASAAAQGLGVSIGVYALGDDAAAQTGLGAGGALLVRPDDFVGWRVESLPADPPGALRRVLARILDRPA